nr:molybdopterin molybdotransferase MoeA [Pseudoflavonifractor sp. MSJ-37]
MDLMRAHWKPAPELERIPLTQSLGRVTAEDLTSVNTLPVVRSSRFDGIAVRKADFADGLPDPSRWVKGRDFVQADTGDDFPDAFDTVIAVEDVILEGDGVRFREGFRFDPDEVTVAPAGDLVRSGALLVPAHTRLTPELVASLAMGGITEVPVFRPLKIAFLPTGSELIPAGQKPQRGQNIEVNSLLSGYLGRYGAEVQVFSITKDDPAALERTLDQALTAADLILINDGTSRGEEDFNAAMLERRASFFRHGIRAVPGRPAGLSMIDGKPVLNVPGPVGACYLAAYWCLSALTAHYYGLPAPLAPTVTARLTEPMKSPKSFERISRVALAWDGTEFTATPLDWKLDGVPALLYQTDAFVTVPIGVEGYAAGDLVKAELLKAPELISGIPPLV